MMDNSSRNSMSSSSRRNSFLKPQKSLKSPKNVGGLVILVWMIIAPLVWNLSNLFVGPKASDGEHLGPQTLMLDAPAVRELKPTKRGLSKGAAKDVTQKQSIKKPAPSLRNEAQHVMKGPKTAVRKGQDEQVARNEVTRAPDMKVFKAASPKQKSEKPSKKKQSPKETPAKMMKTTEDTQFSKKTKKKSKKETQSNKEPMVTKNIQNTSTIAPQKKIPEKSNSTTKNALGTKAPLLTKQTIDRAAPAQNSTTASPITISPTQSNTTKNEQLQPLSLSSKSEISYEEVWNALKAIVEVLTASNVDYFLTAGSLLGFSRSNNTQNPWMDSDVDLAVSTSWLKTPGNVEKLRHNLTSAGFVWSKDYMGVDGTALTLGGSQCYTRHNVTIELVSTEVSPNFHINGFRHEHYRLGCPKPYSKIEEMEWGDSSLLVRVPSPVHAVLQATYGKEYSSRRIPQQEYESSRMEDVTSTGACMVVKNLKEEREKKESRGFQSGILTVVSTEESIAHTLVLARHLSAWGNHEEHSQPAVPLEVHHSGELSYYIEAKLTLYPFVTVVNLRTLSNFRSKQLNYTEANVNMQALHFTKLRHVLWVRPSIQFLYNPFHLLQTAEFIHSQDPKCKELPEGGSCITATDPIQTELLELAQHDSEHVHLTRTLPVRFSPKVFLNGTSLAATTVYEAIDGVGLWMQPTSNYSRWATDDIFDSATSFVMGKRHQAPTIASEYHTVLKSYWEYLVEARRVLLLDRGIEWVPYDGGLFWQHMTLNSVDAVHESHALHAPVVNVGLTMSKDKHTFVVHNERQFTPYQFPGNKLPNFVSSMKNEKLRNLTIPCLPEATARKWLYDNPYVNYKCGNNSKLSGHDEYLLYSIDAEVSYDLKATSGDTQIDVAKALVNTYKEWDEAPLDHGLVSVRFFDVMNSSEVTSSIFSEHGLNALSSDRSLERLSYYVTVPSLVACCQVISWIVSSTSLKNKKVLGCHVELEDTAITNKWDLFVEKHNISLDVLGMQDSPARAAFSKFPEPKAICDITQKQSSPNRTFWKTSHIACVEAGFFYIMHPWSIPMNADFFPLPSGMEGILPKVQNRMMKSIVPSQLTIARNATDPIWLGYLSHWGLTHLSDWSNRRSDWFKGNVSVKKPASEANSQIDFQGATQTLVSMLFLRLEELGLATLDDAVPISGPKTGNLSVDRHTPLWRHVLTNTAGRDGSSTGTRFDYNNDIWKYAPDFVQSSCGMNFTTAMYHFILEPSGMVGAFDLHTARPPYAARGFVGPLDDLLLMGSIFVNQGVSPKTRRQVLTAASVERILSNSVLDYDPTKKEFYNHKIVQNMARFWKGRKLKNGDVMPRHAIDGYGHGLWCVNGWRQTKQGDPIRGWLSQGSSEVLLYFDVTGMVMAFHSPTAHSGYDLRAAFANTVRDVGDHILDSVIPKF